MDERIYSEKISFLLFSENIYTKQTEFPFCMQNLKKNIKNKSEKRY